jgi:hypothetical protein
LNWRLPIAGVLLWPLQAAAVELRAIDVVTGTAGLSPSPIEIRNASAVPLACTAELAHWYSVELGGIQPEARKIIDLWFDAATGTYVILNHKQENMPVEALWCGMTGRAYETRALLALERHTGGQAKAAQLTCSIAGERLACK